MTTGKLISLSKSREYTKLASQVPNVYMIKDGKPVLDLGGHKKPPDASGFLGQGGSFIQGTSKQEKYLRSLE